ncbi:unnamed protein product [Adineta steineri]|uniref:SH3 domain-containing protein n=1 Tax=Adineta steineri TaxID=433720 RepID=A0A819L3W7_9BILA|nr:unnamed protein product [Adineta steineri]CAF3956415.1 unnamed protein product [Adineta steineri]
MWKKIKEILCKHTAYKDESNTTSTRGTISASVIDLKPLPSTPSRRTETLHHHHHHHHEPHHRRPYRKVTGKSTLNKTDEHCRSLFNLLPTSFRSRHHHQQASNNKGIDASTTTTTKASPSIDIFGTDYDSGYMSQSVLNRTSSYVSCYSAVATTMPVPSMISHGSIESILNGYSKSNPANIRVLVRKNFEPFAQAHIGVTKGTLVTALFSRGPWLYIRIESTGQTGYIPRIICSLYKNRIITTDKNYSHHHHLSISSTDSSSNKDDELDLTVSSPNNKCFIRPYRQQQKNKMNRYLSHSSAFINDQEKSTEYTKKYLAKIDSAERERRNTCTLPPPLPSTLISSKDRRLTLGSINWPITTNQSDTVGIHQINDISIINNKEILPPPPPPPRDTDSSSTQDSGYSESTPYFLVQQATPDTEQPPTITNPSKKSTASAHYVTVRRSSLLKIPDTINTYHNSLRRQQQQQQQTIESNHPVQHRHTLLNGLSVNDMLANNINKRHSFGAFHMNNNENYDQLLTKSVNSTNNSLHSRPIEFALIRNVRRDKDDLYQRIKPTIHNLPKSHRQIPASIILKHHRQQQKQQFGSSHSAFRPVQPTLKSKRASSEGHSPSSDQQILSPTISLSSSSSSSLSSSTSSLSKIKKSYLLKQRRLSCDIPMPVLSYKNSNSLTRSVCGQTSMKNLNHSSRTMSEILCDQFSEINLDAIEKDSLTQPIIIKNSQQMKKNLNPQQNLFTITKDYRSSRASFSVKRGDSVNVLKQVGRACFLVRKQNNGQIGFLPKALMIPTTPTTKIDTFLETHGYRETVI